jgi:hypothetical protein
MYEQAITDAMAMIGFTRMDDWSDVSGCPVPIKGKILQFYKPNTKEAIQVYVGPISDENMFDDDFRNAVVQKWPLLHEETIGIAKCRAQEVQAFLTSRGDKTGKMKWFHTVEFDDGVEAEMEVWDSDDPTPYIKATLFRYGQMIAELDLRDELLGDYIFEVGPDTYKVIVKET